MARTFADLERIVAWAQQKTGAAMVMGCNDGQWCWTVRDDATKAELARQLREMAERLER